MINGSTVLAIANFSVGLAFLCSLAVPLGSLFVETFLSGPVLWDMTGIARQLPVVLGNYWIPAIAIYFVLRYSRIANRYDFPRWAHAIVGVGNAMLIIYLSLRLAASLAPGGGAGFVVASVGGLILALPGYVCLLVGLLYAIGKKSPSTASPGPAWSQSLMIGVAEGLGLIAAAAVPVASVIWMYAGTASPFRLARDAERMFNLRCMQAGESISNRVASIEGLYIEKDDSFVLNGLKDGVYSGIGFGSLGKGLQALGLISFYEIRRHAESKAPLDGEEYLRFLRDGKKPTVVSELLSEYALLWRDIATPTEKALKISGSEYALVERKSGEQMARTVFFISSMHRKICGHPGGTSYDVSQFVRRAVTSPTVAPASR